MPEKVLFVDNEGKALKEMERVLADVDVTVLKADNAKAALRLIGAKEIAVLVTDNRMPGMCGIELLTRLMELSPETVKILMTGHADLTNAIEAINIGEVFRFIVKPWENEALIRTVQEGVEHYRFVHTLRNSDETNLLALARTIESKDPCSKGHCERVSGFALMIADHLELPEETKRNIKYGSWLHDCGKIGVPDAVLNFTGKLKDAEFKTIRQHPVWGARVARQARFPQTVINIVLFHHERYDGEGYPHGLRGREIPIEARIVTIADIYDALTSKRSYREALPWEEALDLMDAMKGNYLDPDLMWLFHAIIVNSLDAGHAVKKAGNYG
jgi:putative two-component system response regulator